MHKLFTPLKFGSLQLKNRVVLGSMTRCRADPSTGNVTPIMVEYYRQRAQSAGLVLSECVFIDQNQNPYPGAGGMVTDEHAKGWKSVVDSVHREKSVIFAQLYHPGRVVHPDISGEQPIAPSPIACSSKAFVHGKFKDNVVPREMLVKDIQRAQQQFVDSAKIAKKAGFDGIELHASNGYLLDQFLRSHSNTRKDTYGGSVQNRARFLLETVEKVFEVFPPDRVGVKLSLVGRFNSMYDKDPLALGECILKELQEMGVLYVQLAEAESRKLMPENNGHDQIENCAKEFRKFFKNFLITNGFDGVREGMRRLEQDEADLVAFSTLFLANPDLTERIKNGWELASPKRQYLYSPGPLGYTDYPNYEAKK